MIPKIQVIGPGDYARNGRHKTGSITCESKAKAFDYNREMRLTADIMDAEEVKVLACFVEAGTEFQRAQVASEAVTFTFAETVEHTSVTV